MSIELEIEAKVTRGDVALGTGEHISATRHVFDVAVACFGFERGPAVAASFRALEPAEQLACAAAWEAEANRKREETEA